MARYLVFIDCNTIDQIDNALGAGVDSGIIDHYAVITENGAPILYDQSSDPAADFLNSMGAACMGVTEIDHKNDCPAIDGFGCRCDGRVTENE